MTTLDEFFRPRTDSLTHPLLRNWKAHLATARVEVLRPESDFGQSQPEMNLQSTENGKVLPLETVNWDDDLNHELIKLGMRAVSPEQEAERFALGLRAAMRKPEREFGDGYVNTVLVDLLRDSDLIGYPEITEVLEHACANPPHRNGKELDKYNLCREMIAAAISGRAHELTDSLKYSRDEAKTVLINALAQYLDERFSVRKRHRLGLL
jgi:hypothetical protein